MGPPYLPTTAQLGGLPVPRVDDPICAVLLVFFVGGAVLNMTILQINRRRGHKFLFSGMAFGFCMARTSAMVMRIVWASRPTNLRIAIAASVMTLAGVVLLFVINLAFAQRLLRAYRPRLGWHRVTGLIFRFLYASVVACLVMLIAVSIDSFYTLNAAAHRADRKVQLVGGTYFAALAFLPWPILLACLYLPPHPPHHGPVESFGHGRLATKVALLLFTSLLLSLGAGFRIGVNFAPRPLQHPAWYHSKACFYCFNFVVEIIVLYTYTLARFDLRFHVPNGSSAPGHYAAGGSRVAASPSMYGGSAADAAAADTGSADASPLAGTSGLVRKKSLADRVNLESDVFGSDSEPNEPNATMEKKTQNWDARARKELQKEAQGEAV